MKKRLLIFSSIIASVSLVLFFVLSIIIVQISSEKNAKETIVNYAKIYVQNYTSPTVVEVDDSIRVTIIDSNGKVIGDSKNLNIELMENHLAREEVQHALSGNPKVEKRYSATVGARMLYYAEKVNIPGDDYVFLRVATPTAKVNSFAIATIPMLVLILVIVSGLSMVLSAGFSKKVLEPLAMVKNSLSAINSDDFVKRLPTSNDDDINLMLIEINSISQKLKNTVDSVKKNAKERAEFFANASHELKTPLTAIKGFNELMEINNKDANLNANIQFIKKESQRMLSLIDDMLWLSTLENQSSVEKSEINLIAICQEVMEGLAPLIESKAIKIEVAGSGKVFAEQRHMYDLIKNLTENAIKYNNQGGKVSIFVKEHKKVTTFEIADNGIGIDKKLQPRLFERFYRVEKGRSKATGGTGLGLAIVKHICSLYNAQINLTSDAGVGTTIKIEFNSTTPAGEKLENNKNLFNT